MLKRKYPITPLVGDTEPAPESAASAKKTPSWVKEESLPEDDKCCDIDVNLSHMPPITTIENCTFTNDSTIRIEGEATDVVLSVCATLQTTVETCSQIIRLLQTARPTSNGHMIYVDAGTHNYSWDDDLGEDGLFDEPSCC